MSQRLGHNVWARNLHDGSTALIYINSAPETATVTCDAECLARAQLKIGVTYRVRNILQRTNMREIALTNAGLGMQVQGDARSVLIKLTPL